MADIRWLWNRALQVYARITGTSGRRVTVGASKLLFVRNEYARAKAPMIAELTQRLATGEIDLPRWLLEFRQELKTIYINQYVSARGGLNAMTSADWGSIGGQLREQYNYMNGFAEQIAQGNLSPAQIKARTQLYFESSTQAHERGKAAGRDLDLPQYPGDGNTQCRSNCKCEWIIAETDIMWECTWKLNPAEHCPDCLGNAARWNPLLIPKSAAVLREERRRRLGLE